MADRPILFSAPMVRSILREIAEPGTGKTQTRRIIQPYEVVPHPFKGAKAAPSNLMVVKVPARLGGFIDGPTFNPRFAPDDRLWVRERHHRTTDGDNHLVGYDFADGPCDHMSRPIPGGGTVRGFRHSLGDWGGRCSRNFPGIHMPRWASRQTLHVTDVRVQRLQDISEDDARAEGPDLCTEDGRLNATYRIAFANLWNSLNAERAPWTSNPWVVAVTFRPVLANIDSKEAADG